MKRGKSMLCVAGGSDPFFLFFVFCVCFVFVIFITIIILNKKRRIKERRGWEIRVA
jgi:hypothetical protein